MKVYHMRFFPIFNEWLSLSKDKKLHAAKVRGYGVVVSDQNSYQKIENQLKDDGWEISQRKFPRSTLCEVSAIAPDKEKKFVVSVMPYDQAVIFLGVLAHAIQHKEVVFTDVPHTVE